jgi:hypothetical protein
MLTTALAAISGQSGEALLVSELNARVSHRIWHQNGRSAGVGGTGVLVA